ncbi:MAG: hypothetical protein IPM29_25730 [Planctomycetes bacterium]|nr:hypothetical protein [Planctomycetota bacterium]
MMRGGALTAVVALALLAPRGAAQDATAEQNYKVAGGRSTWPHRIDVYGPDGRAIDPGDPGARPYSPAQTCKKCHDLKAIQHGWHFAAAEVAPPGRSGEPFVWTDPRTATQLPLSYRDWPGTFRPETVGLDPVAFAGLFGRHLPGGLAGYAGGDPQTDRRRIVGELEIDCMACHDGARRWSHERWAEQIALQNFAFAPTAAYGLARIDGRSSALPDDLDPSTPEGAAQLPAAHWDPRAFDVDGKVFFDVVRVPPAAACYACHSVRDVAAVDAGPFAEPIAADPRWVHDGDVHLRAGMSCSDCHRNGLEHHTVRGFDGEEHPSGRDVHTLSCRGCHLDETDGHGEVLARGGRLGAPKAVHRGLPPLHLQTISCTACHAGERPGAWPRRVQTSLAHGLGLASQTRTDADAPRIVEPVLARDADGVIRPHRAFWPTFWARETTAGLVPIPLDEATRTLRRALRVRKDLAAELGALAPDEQRAKLAAALGALGGDAGAAVLITGGRLWRAVDGGLAGEPHELAQARSWALGHDVRPARDAVGVGGCADCHAADATFVHHRSVALGLVPDADPPVVLGVDAMGLDADLVAAWERSFAGRGAFKWIAGGSLLLVTLVLLVHVAVGFDAVLKALRGRRRGRGAEATR